MKTLKEAWDLIEQMNDEAHDQSMDAWLAADAAREGDDDNLAEDLSEEASNEQSEYFRELVETLNEEQVELIRHWLDNDYAFREQYLTYYGFVE